MQKPPSLSVLIPESEALDPLKTSKYFSAKIIKSDSLTFRFSKQSKQLADEQIGSLVDFVSNILEISKSCNFINS